MTERVLLLAVRMPGDDYEQFESSLEELASLAETADGSVEDTIIQNRKRIHPAYYIGEGKAAEIGRLVHDLEIDLVISNDELSAGQIRNLNDAIGVRTIDRSQLILDIFARRAHTKEGKLQVELAQLEYTLPRLRGQGEQMSRLGAGIGTRGPGETKLETDQRYIRKRIDDIKRQLKQVVKQREQYRKRRRTNDIFQIGIVGYTNAGKSTLFNQLTKDEAKVENKLFATLDPLTRHIHLPSGLQALVTDTVGFIQDLPTTLVAAFRSTLEEVTEADFILHITDASSNNIVQQQETVDNLLQDLGADTIPQLIVYNKQDKLSEDFIPMQHPSILASVLEPDSVNQIFEKVEELLKQEWDWYSTQLKPHQGKLLYRLESETIVTQRFFHEDMNVYIVKGYMRPDHELQSLVKES